MLRTNPRSVGFQGRSPWLGFVEAGLHVHRPRARANQAHVLLEQLAGMQNLVDAGGVEKLVDARMVRMSSICSSGIDKRPV